MIDLGSKGSNTSSESWLRSSLDSKVGVKIGSKMGSKSKNWCSQTYPINEVWLKDIGDFILRCTDTRFNVDSGIW